MKSTHAGPIKAPTGSRISAKSWLTEAPLRMLMNWSVEEWQMRRDSDPDAVAAAARESIAVHRKRRDLGFRADAAAEQGADVGGHGGVGMGYSQHAGFVIVCDGSEAADRRIERVLWNDPATGVMRHADAGYEEAIACAREQGLNLPMVPGVNPR